MSELTLIIGNYNYSAWSLCAWSFLRKSGLAFDTVRLRIDTPTFKDEVARYGPGGAVPVLRHGNLTIWDSLAICEYVAELTGRGWPAERSARAVARSVCAEVHAGFINLRTEWPMNARARNRRTAITPGLEADVERIEEIWMDCRRRFGAVGGPWLFGEYTIADAMYAPVVLRFNTYGAQLSDVARWYMAHALADSTVQEWVREAQEEPWTDPSREVG